MLKESAKKSSGSGPEKIILVSKGDFGVPNRGLAEKLNPLDKKACQKLPNEPWRLIKGQSYEFKGDPAELKNPRGIQLLFEVKK